MVDEKKRSKNEAIKEASNYLKGTILEELSDKGVANFSHEAYELLKFHGTYQQFDRDKAEAAKKEASQKGMRAGKEDKEWIFMVRMKIPGGRLRADQYLRLDQVAEKYANGTLRITTRETFQFHFIVKGELKQAIAGMNDELVNTIGACGDIVRNIVTTPAPIKDKAHMQLWEDAKRISDFTMPKTTAYHEIWLDGKNMVAPEEAFTGEPLYGKCYLPRKFKIGLAIPEDNCTDVLTNDLAIISMYKDGELQGYNFALGGGLGTTHNKPETYPRLATPSALVKPEDLLRGVEAVVALQRDHGDRENRKHARLKYLVEEKGTAWIKDTLETYFGAPLDDPLPMPPFQVQDHMGWHDQKDGKWYLGIPISSGRIIDRGVERIRTGLREVITQFSPSIILTADQNIILCDIEEKDKLGVTALLKQHGIKLAEELSPIYRNFLACVALPTCGLALAEAERIKLPLVEQIEQVMQAHNVAGQGIIIRISGCPNACSRPYSAEIGIIGRMPGHYALFVGGSFEGTRLSAKILDRVPYEHIRTVIDTLMGYYVRERQQGEAFGDFCHRKGNFEVKAEIEKRLGARHKWAVAA